MDKPKCFACNKTMKGKIIREAHTEDGQMVWVGPDCYKKICNPEGYQPPKGGPRLFAHKVG